MENVVLTVHLLLALALIGVVLLQRSEGGGLGLGGGGGGGSGIMSGRSAASALSKVTWVLAVAFIVTSLGLTVIAARNSASGSVVDRLGISDIPIDDLTAPLGSTDTLMPPTEQDGSPLVPIAD